MNDKELLKEIESLKKRIAELELQNKNSLNMFGRAYNQIGNSNSDVLIKTKGQVKIQWGSKFIDLIKEGKINVDTDFIFSIKSSDKIGSKDGVYVTDDGFVYLKVGNIPPINLVGESGNTYVSFLAEQETDANSKYNALVNIGFIYKSLEQINDVSLKNGIIYIESEQKLYIVQDGSLQEFKTNIQNPFIGQFVIQKNNDLEGALVIKGTGTQNSISFDTFQIYSLPQNSIIDSKQPILIKKEQADIINIDDTSVEVYTPLIDNMIMSIGASENMGFRLYYLYGKSVLEVDKVIERESSSSIPLYPEYWLLNNTIIENAYITSSEEQDLLEITLTTPSDYQIGDILCLYLEEVGEDSTITYTKVELQIVNISEDKKDIQTKCDITLDSEYLDTLVGKFLFLIKTSSKVPIRIKDNNLDIVQYENTDQNTEKESIKARFGELSELNLDIPVNGEGIYTELFVLGGKTLPRYTNELNSLISNLDMDTSSDFDNVLPSIGLLKQVFKNYTNTLQNLEKRIGSLESIVQDIKDQLQ